MCINKYDFSSIDMYEIQLNKLNEPYQRAFSSSLQTQQIQRQIVQNSAMSPTEETTHELKFVCERCGG